MRRKLFALALAAMLAITGGIAAAGAGSGSSAVEQPPDDYTVDVTAPFGDISSDEVDEAIQTAWSNERVQRYIDDDNVHFDVVKGTEQVEVHIAPSPDAEEQVVAEIGPDGTVTEVFEPTLTREASEEYDVTSEGNLSEDNVVRVETEEDDETLTADEAIEVNLSEDNIEGNLSEDNTVQVFV
ncbi:hypothetical protein [Natronomonas marina]|jgi:hypothetical protein|uniref:hypothetical protein n=1 Tax=Natronomonas marina TaxID=2961939 RepID=UPI0020C9E507|nr:hypothetical protein [Natronomonas marina]